MRKSRIIIFGLLIALSVGAFKLLEQTQFTYLGGQTANIKDTVLDPGSLLRPTIVGGDSADVVAQPVIDSAVMPIATSSENQSCGANFGAHLGLVRYLNDDNIIFARNTDGRWPIASITKLMTAVIASEQGILVKHITFTDSMTKTEGDAGNFKTGDIMSGSDILKGMLLISSNDAAEALAQTIGRDTFIALMNEKAKALRMLDTTYFDPSGLSPRNQSTPNDLYLFMSYLQAEHPELLAITRQKKVTVTERVTMRKRTILNINEFAGQTTFIGGKTGYIVEAEGNGNLVSLFTRNGQPLLVVVLGSPDRFGETRTLLKCI